MEKGGGGAGGGSKEDLTKVLRKREFKKCDIH